MHAGQIELAVANLLNYRIYTIVPNVSYGLGLNHECDLLALDKDGRFTEIEIKISLSDLKADFKKSHGHKSKCISRLIYAFPKSMLEKALPVIPLECGIILVVQYEKWNMQLIKAEWYRQCKHDKTKGKPSPEILNNFYRFGCMRIWSLKGHNNNNSKTLKPNLHHE